MPISNNFSNSLIKKLENIENQFLFQGSFDEPLAVFLCNGGKGFKGEFVYIRDDREAGAGVEYFSLCEVQVFGMPGQKNFSFYKCIARLSSPAV